MLRCCDCRQGPAGCPATCVPGGPRREVATAAMACFMEERGDDSYAGPVSAGSGWDFRHAALGETTLAAGSLAYIAVPPRILGYSSRTIRCVAVGTPRSPHGACGDCARHPRGRVSTTFRSPKPCRMLRARELTEPLEELMVATGAGDRQSAGAIPGKTTRSSFAAQEVAQIAILPDFGYASVWVVPWGGPCSAKFVTVRPREHDAFATPSRSGTRRTRSQTEARVHRLVVPYHAINRASFASCGTILVAMAGRNTSQCRRSLFVGSEIRKRCHLC